MEMTSKNGSCIFLIIGFIFVAVFGGLPYYFTMKELSKVIPTNSWTAISAKLNKVDMKVNRNTDDDGDVSYTYSTIINYSYLWEFVEMQGSRVSYSYRPSGDEDFHRAIHDKLKKSAAIEIYVNPSNPSESVIVRGFVKGNATILWWTLSFVFISMGVFLLQISSYKEKVMPYSKYLLWAIFFQYIIGLLFILSQWENSDLLEKIVLH